MARSLNGGAPDKPVVPLRYRINPDFKKLDELDALEKELRESPLERVNVDVFNDLLEDLQRRRAKLFPEPKAKPLTKEEKAAKQAQEDEERYASMPFEQMPNKWRVWWLKFKSIRLTEKQFCVVLGLVIATVLHFRK